MLDRYRLSTSRKISRQTLNKESNSWEKKTSHFQNPCIQGLRQTVADCVSLWLAENVSTATRLPMTAGQTLKPWPTYWSFTKKKKAPLQSPRMAVADHRNVLFFCCFWHLGKSSHPKVSFHFTLYILLSHYCFKRTICSIITLQYPNCSVIGGLNLDISLNIQTIKDWTLPR